MLGQAHAGLGWLIGVSAPTSDRKLRIWCTAAAILPDVDALALLFGGPAYDRYHHTFGHNLFMGVLCVSAAAWYFRGASTRAWLGAIVWVAVAFASHLLTDMKLSGWPLHLLWPVNRKAFEFHPNIQVGAPINIALAGILMVLPFVVGGWKSATPLEILSPHLDHLFLNLFRPRNRQCSVCARPCNHRCEECTRPVCLRHAKIGWRFRVHCPSCTGGGRARMSRQGAEEILARELGFIRSPEGLKLDTEFAELLERKLTGALKRLDAVPRTHELWKGSDHQPTLAKVADLSRLLLHETPDDEEARWVLFADSVRSCSADYSPLEPLVLRDFATLHWLVAAARWNFMLSGVDPVVALRKPFESLGKTIGSVETVLGELARDPNPRTREAAARCLELFRGRNPWKARPLTPGDLL